MDNLELTAPSIEAAEHGMQLMTQFCDLLDLQFDHAKTYFWSTASTERAIARDVDLPIVGPGPGGPHGVWQAHHQPCLAQANLSHVPSLDCTCQVYRQKAYALRVKGWPQAQERAEVYGPAAHAPGISPMVPLSLVEHPLTDPGRTVHTFRRHADLDKVSTLIDNILRNWADLVHRPGPCHVLLERLHSIGWQWIGHGWMTDHAQMPIDLFHGSSAEIQHSLCEGWQHLAQR